jgi:Ion channel
MRGLVAILGIALLMTVLWDGFETIVLPRRVRRRIRLTRLFYTITWRFWSGLARRMRPGDRRDGFLSYYGPLSLILLIGVWAICLALGFAMMHWGFGSILMDLDRHEMGFGGAFYMSGSTLFTLGIGDVTPRSTLGRALTVAEAGTGIAFLALVIGYLPVIYQAFSRRETNISLLDARAGSPPSAGAATPMTTAPTRSCSFCATGSAGHLSYWKAISRIRYWPTIALSTIGNPGWRR